MKKQPTAQQASCCLTTASPKPHWRLWPLPLDHTHLPLGCCSGVDVLQGTGPFQGGRSVDSVLLTSRPRMKTPVLPLRGGSVRARGPHRRVSGVDGTSRLWIFLSWCRLLEALGRSKGVLVVVVEAASSTEALRSRRWRSGVR